MADWANYLVFDILGDLCYARSFGIKEPGPNELKFIPELICDYMKFGHPVSGFASIYPPFVRRAMLFILKTNSLVSRSINASTVKVSKGRGIFKFGIEEDKNVLTSPALLVAMKILFLENSEWKMILANRCHLLARPLPMDSRLAMAQA